MYTCILLTGGWRNRADIAYGFLQEIEQKYGSVQRYVREELGFSADDVQAMYQNLRAKSDA